VTLDESSSRINFQGSCSGEGQSLPKKGAALGPGEWAERRGWGDLFRKDLSKSLSLRLHTSREGCESDYAPLLPGYKPDA
jgi:hypothetical protein